jgi:hypothetical protein
MVCDPIELNVLGFTIVAVTLPAGSLYHPEVARVRHQPSMSLKLGRGDWLAVVTDLAP